MRKKTLTKRSMALAMALCMAAPMPSATAFAKQDTTVKAVKTAKNVKADVEYELTKDWTLSNPAEGKFVVNNANKVTFHSQPGELGQVTNAKNVLLYDMPEGDFAATLKVTNDVLTSNYQAIGLAAYASTSRVAGTMRRYHKGLGGNVFAKMNFNGKYDEAAKQDTSKDAPAWLKLERQGDKFIHSYSYDGENFTVISETTNNNDLFACKDLKIAIYTGGAQTFDAVMENFAIDGKVVSFGEERQPVEIKEVAAFEDVYANYGTSLEDLNLPTSVDVTLEDGTSKKMAVNWDADTYKPKTAGVQNVTGTVELEDYVANTAGLKAEVKVHVMEEGQAIPVVKITLDRTEIAMAEDSSIELKAETFPLNAADKTVAWESDNTEVATVDAEGKVTAVGKGTAVITAKAGEAVATCEVTVTEEVVAGTTWGVTSPNENVQMTMQFTEDFGLTYEATKGGKAFIEEASVLGLKNSTIDTTKELTFVSSEKEVIDETYKTYSGKFSENKNHATQLKLTFKDSTEKYLYSVIARVYDDGVAFSYELEAADGNTAKTVQISDEMSTVNVPDGATTWSFDYGGAYERNFEEKAMEDLSGKPAIPTLYQTDDTYVLFNEANLMPSGFCGSMFRTSYGSNTFNVEFANEQSSRGPVTVDLPFTSPWRYAVVGDLETITENTMAENLSPAPDEETYHYSEWVEPGIASWTWLAEGETRSGQSNVDAVLRYIDMAAELGWKYFLWDDGWQSDPANNVMHPRTQEVIDYAAERGIGILVWVNEDYINTDAKREERFKIWSEMGIKGIKADFFDGEHQTEVEEYNDIYEDLAKYKMVGIMHGCNKPTGETRTYPHILAREGIRGDEFVNRSQSVQKQLTILPFTRSAVGPADYTPLFDLPNKNTGEPIGNTDKTVGSQLTIPVLIESGIPCMADKDSTYLREDIRGFYDELPATWDETRLINGEVGEYVTMARRSGDTWYIVANTDETARTEHVDLADYLEEGANYKTQIWYDGPDDSDKTDIVTERKVMTAADSIDLKVARKGGSVIRLTKLADTQDPDTVWVDELKERLAKRIEDAKAMDLSLCTEESVKNLQKAIEKAEAFMSSETATEEEVFDMLNELQAAMNELAYIVDGYGRIEFEEADSITTDRNPDNGRNTGIEGADGGKVMNNTFDGAWYKFDVVKFGNVAPKELTIRYSGANNCFDDARVELRLGDKDGELLATVDTPKTGSWSDYTTATAEIDKEAAAKLKGTQSICFVLRGTRASGKTYAGNFNWVEFAPGEEEIVESDKTMLEALIGYADSQKENEDYANVIPVVKAAFEKALADAKAVYENTAATQEEVDAAYDKLLDMVHMLDFIKGDTTNLKALVDVVKGMNKDLFTKDSWAAVEDALANAEAVLADENAMQEEIDAATKALQDAKDALVRIPVDKSKLEKLVNKAKKYEDKIAEYTPATAGIFKDTLEHAREVLANEEVAQKDIDDAYAMLQNAIFGLRLQPNKDKLEDLIKDAKAVDTANYTAESAAAFTAALAKAEAVFADANATEEDVKAAEKALKKAQKDLVAKADADEDKKDTDKKDNDKKDNDKKADDKVASADGNKKPADKAAKTGDANTALPAAVTGVAALAVLMALKKRR